MAIFDLFSRRQRKLKGEVPDVYVYDELPGTLRVQLVHIWRDVIGDPGGNVDYGRAEEFYSTAVDILRKEYGVFQLPGTTARERPHVELFNFFLKTTEVDRALDVVQLCARIIDNATRDYSYRNRTNAPEIADDALVEINERLREAGVGYEIIQGDIVRIDAQYIHHEATKPALAILQAPRYAGAQQEFLSAHEHFRKGKNKEALTDCLKAFESLMKAICEKRGWTYGQNDTAKALIDVMFTKELVPAFWQAQFSSLRSLLESSIPTGRNKLSGHGQGASPKEVPGHLAAYMLHMTASTIVFLAMAEEALP